MFVQLRQHSAVTKHLTESGPLAWWPLVDLDDIELTRSTGIRGGRGDVGGHRELLLLSLWGFSDDYFRMRTGAAITSDVVASGGARQ